MKVSYKTFTNFMYLVCLFISCHETKPVDNHSTSNQIDISNDSLDLKFAESTIEYAHHSYYIGDVNNDKKSDTAYVTYKVYTTKDSTMFKDCANKDCSMIIKFTNGIPDLTIDLSLGVYIEKTEDLNKDKANEIILFSEWFPAHWHTVYVWTLKKGKWTEIAKTTAFLAENEDYKNRIVKKKSQLYLIGDNWNTQKGDLEKRMTYVKINNK